LTFAVEFSNASDSSNAWPLSPCAFARFRNNPANSSNNARKSATKYSPYDTALASADAQIPDF
jgi:hypothetical protein